MPPRYTNATPESEAAVQLVGRVRTSRVALLSIIDRLSSNPSSYDSELMRLELMELADVLRMPTLGECVESIRMANTQENGVILAQLKESAQPQHL